MVRLSVVDLIRRVAVVRVVDDARDEFPHVLRGTLAGLFSEPTWHIVVAFDDDRPPRGAVTAVLDQAKTWAAERQCQFSVAALRDVPYVTAPPVT